MAEGKRINLLKAAKELNIGISTAGEFLVKSGFDIKPRPSTKLTPEMYSVLLDEFQGDKEAKDEAKQIVIGQIRRDESPAETNDALENETKSTEVSDDEEEAPEIKEKEQAKEAEQEEERGALKVVGKIDLDNLGGKKSKAKKPSAKSKVEKTEAKKEEPAKEKEEVPELKEKNEPKKEAVEKKEAPQEPVKAEIEEESIKEKTEAPNVSTEEKSAKNEDEEKKKEDLKAEKVEDAPTEDKAAPSEPTTIVNKEEKQNEVIRGRSKTLTGPKVLGKIELPQKKTSKPVASSSDDKAGTPERRKRKRKKKVADTPDASKAKRGAKAPDRHEGKRRRKGKQAPKEEPTEKEIQDQIKATLARLSGAGKSGKFSQRARLRRQKRDDIAETAKKAAQEEEKQSKLLRLTEFVTANELANLMDVPVTDVIGTCMNLGMFVSINQRLDAETLTVVADEYGFEVEFIKPEDEDHTDLEEPDNEENLIPRAPIVTVMGHVDHGKTSLLDYIRHADVTGGEAGGITQHIGAYAVTLESGSKITFLDTPGHEAFTAMRARGAQVTDVAIIVIAADDAVMPQTKEAINHAQAANVPIVFAFTKIDKPTANADKIREQLASMNVLVEEWGGKFQAQEISSKTGLNIDQLLEKVLLEAELLDLKADPKKRAVGSVVEASLDVGRGIVTTVLIQGGTLKIGDALLAGSYSGKIKALTNERGERVQEAGPSSPVQILGMSGAPTAGDRFYVMDDESSARQVANKRLQLQREQGMRATKHITLDEIGRRLAVGNFKELNVIVKGDVDGSIEALSDSLLKLSTDEIQINVIHKSVGAISESDVLLASASDAIIVGFQVRPSANARKLAEQEQIDIRLYSIIYDAIEEIKSAMEGMLAPKFEEKIVANVEIRETFKISKVGTIAGCMVLDGKISRSNDIRLIREGVVVYTGKLASLKRFKDDVKEVSAGYECGLNIENYNDIKVGDIVEAFEQVEIQRKL